MRTIHGKLVSLNDHWWYTFGQLSIFCTLLHEFCMFGMMKTQPKSENKSVWNATRQTFYNLKGLWMYVSQVPWYYFIIAIPSCQTIRMLHNNGTDKLITMFWVCSTVCYFCKKNKTTNSFRLQCLKKINCGSKNPTAFVNFKTVGL